MKSFKKHLYESVEFEDDMMGTIESHGEDSMSGVCSMCEPHNTEQCTYSQWKTYADWDLGRPKGHESYDGDEIPFRHKHCGCRWISDSGAEAPSVKDMEE